MLQHPMKNVIYVFGISEREIEGKLDEKIITILN